MEPDGTVGAFDMGRIMVPTLESVQTLYLLQVRPCPVRPAMEVAAQCTSLCVGFADLAAICEFVCAIPAAGLARLRQELRAVHALVTCGVAPHVTCCCQEARPVICHHPRSVSVLLAIPFGIVSHRASLLLTDVQALRLFVYRTGELQRSFDAEMDKKGGRTLGPPGGARTFTVFVDDVSLPEANAWGDQPVLELLRQLVETASCYNLAHDRRGEAIKLDGLQVSPLFSRRRFLDF